MFETLNLIYCTASMKPIITSETNTEKY